MERRSIQPTSKSLLQLNKETTGFERVTTPAPRSGVPSPGRWIRSDRHPSSGASDHAKRRLVGLSSSDPIRWRPRADPVQKQDPGERYDAKKGLTFEGPLQKDGWSEAIPIMIPRRELMGFAF